MVHDRSLPNLTIATGTSAPEAGTGIHLADVPNTETADTWHSDGGGSLRSIQ